jgi:uncharacterized membrane protein
VLKGENFMMPPPFNSLEDNSLSEKSKRTRAHLIRTIGARANAKRTLTEKIADALTTKFGSMTFLSLNLVWFLAWIGVNVGLIPGLPAFDPFPFGLLTMIVSLEAIFLAIIVLISQNRSSKIADLREEVDLQINTIAEAEITKMIELQVMLLKKNGIDLSNDLELERMVKPTDTNGIEVELENELLRQKLNRFSRHH